MKISWFTGLMLSSLTMVPSLSFACLIEVHQVRRYEQAGRISADPVGFERAIFEAVDKCNAQSKMRIQQSGGSIADEFYQQSLELCRQSKRTASLLGSLESMSHSLCQYQATKLYTWELSVEALDKTGSIKSN